MLSFVNSTTRRFYWAVSAAQRTESRPANLEVVDSNPTGRRALNLIVFSVFSCRVSFNGPLKGCIPTQKGKVRENRPLKVEG